MRTYHGIRIKYLDNAIFCSAYRTTEENAEHAKEALCLLLDMSIDELFGDRDGGSLFEQQGGTIDRLYVHGKD